jgi:hypothetical protein
LCIDGAKSLQFLLAVLHRARLDAACALFTVCGPLFAVLDLLFDAIPLSGASMTEAATLESQISQQIVAAMKAHDAERTGTLRMIKSALMNKAIEKRAAEKQIGAALTQQESEQVLATMIKQRRDSIEQFTKGGRPELAAKEAAEIVVIEEFLPKALDEAGLAKLVADALAEVEATLGHKPAVKEMGPVMKAVQARLQAAGARAEGRVVSELVKRALAG